MIRRRILSSLLVVAAATAVAIPALAQFGARQSPPAQISLNTAVPAFEVVGLIPGDYMVRCLRVRNEGTSAIKLVSAASITGALAPYLRIAVERGAGLGDLGPSCTGFAAAGGYGFGTRAGGIAPDTLAPDTDTSLAAGAEKSIRVTIALPASTPTAAAAKDGTVAFAFVGLPIEASTPTGTTTTPTQTPAAGGGVATGTTGGFDKDGNFITNGQVKRLFRVGKPHLLPNGDVWVIMKLPAGGAVRAKVIMGGNVYYAHRLYKRVAAGRFKVVLHRRVVGRVAVTSARHRHRKLVSLVTTRYRWAHGPHAFLQPEQKLVLVKP